MNVRVVKTKKKREKHLTLQCFKYVLYCFSPTLQLQYTACLHPLICTSIVFLSTASGKGRRQTCKAIVQKCFSIKTRTTAATTVDCFSEVKCKKRFPLGSLETHSQPHTSKVFGNQQPHGNSEQSIQTTIQHRREQTAYLKHKMTSWRDLYCFKSNVSYKYRRIQCHNPGLLKQTLFHFFLLMSIK